MDKKDFYTIGYIRRVIGLKGELGVKLDVDNPQRYKGIDSLVLMDDSGITKVSLVQAHLRGEELVIRIEGITEPNGAKKMVGKTVVLPVTALPDVGNKRFYFHEIPGFKVIDAVHGELGVAKEVMDRPVQPVLIIKRGFNEVLIPLLEDTVQLVDREKRELHVKTPEGLVELYLEKSDEEE
ncbi:MAG TPA: ribosome maturation factor RimM [Bacteroidia bacterium]|nr:ribosome maturation factor RimM [Bacteroidia bacterium]